MQESKDLVPVGVRQVVLQSAPRRAVPFGAAPGVPAVAAAELALAAAALAENARAPNTRRAYESDWASWVAFCEAQNFVPLPADPEQVMLYLTHLTDFFGAKGKRLRPRTAERHLAAITTTHCALGLTFNRAHPALTKTLNGIRRKFTMSQKGARALRTEDIIAMCETFGMDIRSLRNKAIVLLGFAGGFRRSEIVGLNAEDLEFKGKTLRVTLRRSKTDQDGEGRIIVIMPGRNPNTCPVAAIRAWLEAADLENEGADPIFRPVNRHSGVELNRLSDRAVDLIVKGACRAAHLKESYSAHSLRAGHVTESLARGHDRASIKRQTGHASDAMLDRYARESDLAANNSSSSLGL